MTTDKLLVKHAQKRLPKPRKPPKTFKFTELSSTQREAFDWYLKGIAQEYGMDSPEYRRAKTRVDNILIRNTKSIRKQKKALKEAGYTMNKIIEHDRLYPGEIPEGVPNDTNTEQVMRYHRELETLSKQYKKRR